MTQSPDQASLEERVVQWSRRAYPWHRAFFIGFNVLLTALNLWTGAPWWGLWPLVITGGLFTLHYLVYKTTMIDEDWVEQRAGDVYGRSYDQGHIDSIAEHHGMENASQRGQRELRERLAQRRAGEVRPQRSKGK